LVKTDVQLKRSVSRLDSFGHAWRGLRVLMGQPNAKIHVLVALGVVVLGVALDVGAWEWCVLSLAMAMVLGAEALNTGIELAVDLAQPEWHELARNAKDVSAAGVLICTLGAVSVGGWVFVPKIWGVL
jgi:diacylglycerol kinase